jgi:hypothetical protein
MYETEMGEAQPCLPGLPCICCVHHVYRSINKTHIMKQNMGNADRITRIIIAAALAALYFTGAVTNSTLATILWVIGIVFFITAVIGYCPLYTLGGFKTNNKRK